MYKKVDAFVDFEDKFAIVMKHSLEIYAKVGDKMKPVVSQVFFMYDCFLQRITAFINVPIEKHAKIVAYVSETYSCVKAEAKHQWLRLDFDKDETVSVDDLKKSMYALYEFLKDFNVLDELSKVKCKLYA